MAMMLDALYIVLESLPNGYKHLQSHLTSFLMEHVLFAYIGVGRDDLHKCWAALDVPPELCNKLADRGVFWQSGRLHLSRAYQNDADLMPWLYNACMTVYSFKKFSSSR